MRARRFAAILALSLGAMWWTQIAAADGAATGQTYDLGNEAAKNPNLFSFNYGPTASPALGLLNLSPSKVSLSNGFEPFVLSIPGLFTNSGGGQSAGFDVSPAWAFQGEYPIHIDDYLERTNQSPQLWEAWYRARTEFAVTTGTASATASKIQQSGMAFGVSTSLLPTSDPIAARPGPGNKTYFQQCVANETDDIGKANFEVLQEYSKKYGNDLDLAERLNTLGGKSLAELKSENIDAKDILQDYLKLVPSDAEAKALVAGLPALQPSSSAAVVTVDQVHKMQVSIVGSQPDFAPTATSIYDKYSIAKHTSDCVTFVAAIASSATDLTVGIGYVEDGKPGALSTFHTGGETGWLAFRVPLYASLDGFDMQSKNYYSALEKATSGAQSLSIGGSFRYSNDSSLVTGNSKTPIMSANVIDAWVGLQGNSSWLQGSVEGGYTDNHATQQADASLSTSGFRWLVASKVNVWSSYWIGVSYGTANGNSSNLNDKMLLVTLDIKAPAITSIFSGPPVPGK